MSQKKNRIFRIVHYQNLRFILTNGLHCALCQVKDSDYISIGHQRLISRRNEWPVPLHPAGTLGDYIPFYFCRKSPMLYSISKGWVEGCPSDYQYDIVYLVSSIEKIATLNLTYLFTDRHACLAITTFFDNYDDLGNLSWDIIRDDSWYINYSKLKKELKQAEFLIHKHMPVRAIEGIICYSDKVYNDITTLVTEFDLELPVIVRPDYYYNV